MNISGVIRELELDSTLLPIAPRMAKLVDGHFHVIVPMAKAAAEYEQEVSLSLCSASIYSFDDVPKAALARLRRHSLDSSTYSGEPSRGLCNSNYQPSVTSLACTEESVSKNEKGSGKAVLIPAPKGRIRQRRRDVPFGSYRATVVPSGALPFVPRSLL